MIFIFWIMCCAFINNSYGFNLTDITNAIEKIVDKANKTATFFAEEFKTDVDNIESVYDKATSIVAKVIHKAMKVGKKVYKSTTSLFRKADKGAFDVVKGFVNGVSEVVGTPINLEQLTFYLVTANNLENPKKIDFHEPEAIAKTKGKIFFLIHGWKASMNSSWYHDISESLTRQNSDTYVVQVNWDEPANDNYAFSAFDTESAGNFIGVLINKLVTEYQVPAKNFVLIGHSLGAQICGRAAKTFKKISGTKLPRIIALDPAGPLFLLRPNSKRLNRHDADVVMVIHTDADKLGFPTTTGTIDFYPNGGDNQPGCWDVDLGNVSTYTEPVTCDHSRAWDYFVEAVNITGSFPSRKCDNYNDFQNNKCANEVVAMGDLETTAEGSFYLYTKSHPIYSEPLPNMKSKQNGTDQKNTS